MSRSRRPSIHVVLDTNSLFTLAADRLVNQQTEDAISITNASADVAVKWYIPEIVIVERKFQMKRKGLELLESVRKLERLLGHSLALTDEILDDRIEAAVKRQLEQLRVDRIELNTTQVNWQELIQNAGYRKPPFDAGEKEKGFRDALVLESFVQLSETLPKTSALARIVLVTGDRLINQAFDDKKVSQGNVIIYPGLDSVLNLFNVLRSEITEDILSNILPKAHTLFYEKNNPSCLYIKERIFNKISEKFSEIVTAGPEPGLDSATKNLYLNPTTFVGKDGQRISFATKLTLAVESNSYEYEITSPSNNSEGTRIGTNVLSGFSQPAGNVLSSFSYANPPNTLLGLSGSAGLGEMTIRSTPTLPAIKQKVRKGKHVFEIFWNGILTTRQKLTRPSLVDLKHLETTWGAEKIT